jgi:hypothetical protein
MLRPNVWTQSGLADISQNRLAADASEDDGPNPGFRARGGWPPCVFWSGVVSIEMTTLNVEEPVRAGANAAVEVPVKKVRAEIPTRWLRVTSLSLSPNNGECDGVAGTPPIADHPKRLDLACSQNHVEIRPRILGS